MRDAAPRLRGKCRSDGAEGGLSRHRCADRERAQRRRQARPADE